MTPEQWAGDVVGLPYCDRADGPDEFDCFGLAMDYVRRVLGRPCSLAGYAEGRPFADLLPTASGWEECDGGFVLCAFNADGHPTHIGVIVGGYVVHAYGRETGGQVFRHNRRAFERLFTDLRIYTYVG